MHVNDNKFVMHGSYIDDVKIGYIFDFQDLEEHLSVIAIDLLARMISDHVLLLVEGKV